MAIIQNNLAYNVTSDLSTSNTVGDWIEVGLNFGLAIQLSGTWSGTVSFEQSNDGVTPYALLMMNAVTTTTSATSATTNSLWLGPVYARYVRVRFSTATSGAPRAVMTLQPCSDQLASSFTVSGTVTLGTGSTIIGGLAASASATSAYAVSRLTGAAASGVIKAAAGRMFSWTLLNTNAAIRYLQIYNKATAGIPGTDTPVVTIPLPISGSANFADQIGFYNATGLSWAITTDAAGTTAGAAADVIGTIFYQ